MRSPPPPKNHDRHVRYAADYNYHYYYYYSFATRKGGQQQSKDEKNSNAENRSAATTPGSLTFDRCVQRESRRRGPGNAEYR